MTNEALRRENSSRNASLRGLLYFLLLFASIVFFAVLLLGVFSSALAALWAYLAALR